ACAILARTRGLTVSSTANPNSAERGKKRLPTVAAVVSRFWPTDLAAVGLKQPRLIGHAFSCPPAGGAAGGHGLRVTLGDAFQQQLGREKVTQLDTLILQLGERLRPTIPGQASAHDFLRFPNDFPQSPPLIYRQVHYLNLHVRPKLPDSLPAVSQFSHPSSPNTMPI